MPTLIVVSGLPGTGKSSIAEGIGRHRGAPVLSVDPIESAMVRAGLRPTFETGLAAYLVAEVLADQHLASGLDVVIDAVSSVDEAREWWRTLARNHGATLKVIVCIVSDEGVHRQRLEQRRRGLALPETSWDAVEARRLEWSDWAAPFLVLDAMDSTAANLARAQTFLETMPGDP